jgi:hypothetical protein
MNVNGSSQDPFQTQLSRNVTVHSPVCFSSRLLNILLLFCFVFLLPFLFSVSSCPTSSYFCYVLNFSSLFSFFFNSSLSQLSVHGLKRTWRLQSVRQHADVIARLDWSDLPSICRVQFNSSRLYHSSTLCEDSVEVNM